MPDCSLEDAQFRTLLDVNLNRIYIDCFHEIVLSLIRLEPLISIFDLSSGPSLGLAREL